ncbi:hypothetical protein DYBT9275_00702 [Dyadobacter sp. CECT 9275]|uniref:Secretion system C-terminal sorting domain-containing protein n=1 Tax=Dyadobacter helix TaxID=2822344 RepID=A0A916J8T2_9BACT|nr:T9SS type A sorting domain-containing protein [Dyadobacter sp. CECT 9275]CAG4991201.1 hypothetical protein DYBT9275_00702 [Dyadobacter sp. CECT 9275]
MATHNQNSYRVSLAGILSITLIFLNSLQVIAQLQIVPISVGQANTQPDAVPNQKVSASLGLPFFDDFSTTATQSPDPHFWMAGSGVFINNTLTTGHPSVNVATFDGLKANGTPYNFTNPLSQNYTDTLTSLPIDLQGKTAADSVYLSFYWQSKGLGEKPDSSDFFQLEVLNSSQQWTALWKRNGYELDTLFHQEFVVIKDPLLFHSGFQFRFRAYGRNSGAYDMWHLDYVYLNAKRSSKDIYIRDIAVRNPLTSYLKTYTAMPLDHYARNPAGFTAANVGTQIVNHYNNENYTSFVLTVKDEISGAVFKGGQEGSTYIGPLKELVKSVTILPLTVSTTLARMRIRYKFDMLTTDNSNPSIPSIDLRRNDSISAVADLSDYFAYDDGSAEYGIQINQKLGRVAIRFVMAKPDTVGGVRMSVVPFNKDISGQSFTLQLWSNKNGKPDQLLTQAAVAARYGTSRNSFNEYTFGKAVAITDTFYVGWLQVNEQPLTVGYDLNSRLGADKVWYNLGTEWVPGADLKGSIMIRPFMTTKGQEVVTGTEPGISAKSFFYPNPSQGIISWKDLVLDRIEVYTVNGNLVKVISPGYESRSASVTELPGGLYIFKGYNGKRQITQKVVIFR